MLAEKLGFEVAQRGELGIATQVRGGGAEAIRAQGEALRAASGLSEQLLGLAISGASGSNPATPEISGAESQASGTSAAGER
jgi:hypothetical protein